MAGQYFAEGVCNQNVGGDCDEVGDQEVGDRGKHQILADPLEQDVVRPDVDQVEKRNVDASQVPLEYLFVPDLFQEFLTRVHLRLVNLIILGKSIIKLLFHNDIKILFIIFKIFHFKFIFIFEIIIFFYKYLFKYT
jgi:hypothetical protein